MLVPNEQYITGLKLSVVVWLRTYCELSKKEVSEILENTKLLEAIENSYYLLEKKPVSEQLAVVKKYLDGKGYDIKVDVEKIRAQRR